MTEEKVKIDNVIVGWFNRTEENLRNLKLNQGDSINNIISAVIPIVENYICCALETLNKGSKLPSMACIRITSELIAKVIWCIEGETKEEINKRIKRWNKTSLTEERRLIDKFADAKNENIKKFYQDRTKHLDVLSTNVLDVKNMPKITDIIEGILDKEGYANVFVQFNRAIHIDTFVLSESINEKDGLTEYTGDVKTDSETLKGCCLSNVYAFLKKIYKYYDLDFQNIDNEFKNQIDSINKQTMFSN